ncbi:MAG: hypothetical protein KGS72_24790 [Cyanobacteria bacterium REEB67]|nr:hypothetical protein [Cyanobacteria bacterium REEB67]
MRKTFVWLGLAASVHVLPAAAHGPGAPVLSHSCVSGLPGLPVNSTAQHHTAALAHSAVISHAAMSAGNFQSFASHLTTLTPASALASQLIAPVGKHGWVAGQPVQLVFKSASVAAFGSSIDLDLSSTKATLSAAFFLKSGDAPVAIDVGGKTLFVTAKSQLTPAEYLSAMAVAAGQIQTLTLDAGGNATGGSVVVTQRLGQSISTLVVPPGVTVTDYSRSGVVNVSGNVSDSGNFYLAGVGASGTLTLNAVNINVQSGGLLSDAVAGSSSSALLINATGSIVNAGTIFGQSNVGLVSGAGQIANSGIVKAGSGSISLATKTDNVDLNVNAAGGTFSAVNGNIDIRQVNYAGSADINLNGGNYLSQNLNINGGAGTVNGSLGQVSGNLNTTAAVAHLTADSAVLTLGRQNISGDPTYANTGDIEIAGPITINGADLAIVAGGNIVSTSSTASITDAGGNVLLIAGALVSSGGGTGGTSLIGPTPGGAATGNVTVALTGGTGGSIDFSGTTAGSAASTAAIAINTSNSAGSGGNVTLVALANGASGGQVLLNNSGGVNAIDTRALGTSTGSTSGSVNIIGGASTTAVQTAQINTGGYGSGGDVSLAAAQATTNDGKNIVLSSAGAVISFNKIVPGAASVGEITFTGINTSPTGQVGGNGGAVSITTGGAITGTGAIVANGDSNLGGGGGNGALVGLSAGTGVSVLNVSASGGDGYNNSYFLPPYSYLTPQSNGGAIIISSTSGDVTVGSIQSSGGSGGNFGGALAGGNGGAGGLVSVTAGQGNISLTGSVFTQGGEGSQTSTVASSGGAGGAIILTARQSIDSSSGGDINASGGIIGTGVAPIPSNPPAYGGAGGAISLTAGGAITTDTGASILSIGASAGSTGTGTGLGGRISIVSAGDITTGNLASTGSGGSITVVSTGGAVTVGSLNNPTAVAAISASGAVTVSAEQSITFTSIDTTNNAIICGSALLASGASSGTAINFGGGNIVTSGNNASGEAWVLTTIGSTVSAYTVNGVANVNEFQLAPSSILGSSGTFNITFTYGMAPTGFSPGGYGSIDTSGSQQIVISTDNPAMVVPLVTVGGTSMSMGGSLTSTGPVGLYSSGGIGFFDTSGAAPITFDALVDTSNAGISLVYAQAVSVNQLSAVGALNVNMFGSYAFAVNGVVSASNVSISAASIGMYSQPSAFIIAPNSNIVISGTTGAFSVGGTFITGASGSVTLANSATGGVISTGNVFANTAELTFDASQIMLGSPPGMPSPIPPVLITNTAGFGNITFENSSGNLLLGVNADVQTRADAFTSIIANTTLQSVINIQVGTQINFVGGGDIYISTPNLNLAASNLIAKDKSNFFIDGGNSAAIVPMNIITSSGSSAGIQTNGGAIIIHPTGDLTFASSGSGATSLSLDAFGTNGNGLVDIQGLGNVTLNDKVTLSSNSPIQLNMNAATTLTLNGSSEIATYFSGNATFPDPLGGTFDYSILVQNLITDFKLAGSGTFYQGGTAPGNTVFNDFIYVGFNDGTNLNFQSANSGSYVNFFTRQIQVNGTLLDAAPLATITAGSNIAAINFNTNLPSFAPGNFAFQPGLFATSASMDINGAQVNVGFPGTVPPVSIPAMQQPVGNLNFGIGGTFNLTTSQSIAMYIAGTATFFSGSSLKSTGGDITIATSSGSNGAIILGSALTAANGSITMHADGDAGIIGAGGTLSATVVNLSSDAGSIGGVGSPINILGNAQNIDSTGGNGNVYLNQTGIASFNAPSQAGVTGVFSVTAPAIVIGAAGSISAGYIIFNTASVIDNGTVIAGSLSGNGLLIQNQSGALTIATGGTGTFVSPVSQSFQAIGDLTLNVSGAQLNSTNNLNIAAIGGTLNLPVSTISVAPDSSGNGGILQITAQKITTQDGAHNLVFDANGAAGLGTGNGGQVNVQLSGTTALTVGTAVGNISASANSAAGGGTGGAVTIDNGGNLTVNAAQITVTSAGNGNGGSIVLGSGSGANLGNLVVSGDLHADGSGTGIGGAVFLRANSKTVFTVGASKTTNGTEGTISVAGATNGSIAIGNSAGSITVAKSLTAFGSLVLSTRGSSAGAVTVNASLGDAATQSIGLYASGAGRITDAAAATLQASNINASSATGTITLSGVDALAAGTSVSAITGSGAAVAITNINGNQLNVANTTGAAVTIKSLSLIDVTGVVNSAAATVSTTGKSGGLIKVGGSILASGNISLSTPGSVNVTGILTSSKNVAITAKSATSSIVVSGTVTAGTAGTLAITLPSSTLANGVDTTAGSLSAGSTITVSSAKTSLSVGTITGDKTVKITALSGILQANAKTIEGVTGVSLSTTSSASGAGGITVANITTGNSAAPATAGGALSVVAAGGILNVLPGSIINANSGKGTKAAITLENKLIMGTTTGTIVVGSNAQITTAGAFGGNVAITMGAPPTAPKGNLLPVIPGLTFTPGNPQNVIFVGNTATNNGVNFATGGGTNPINVNVIGSGVKVIFNTGLLPASAITIDGGTGGQTTLVQADPPVASVAPAAVGRLAVMPFSLEAPALFPGGSTSSVFAGLSSSPSLISGVTMASAAPGSAGGSDASVINTVVSARTLYGEASAFEDLENASPANFLYRSSRDSAGYIASGAGPLQYSLRLLGDGDIEAAIVAGGDLGIADPTVSDFDCALGAGNVNVIGPVVHDLRRGALIAAPDRASTVKTAFGEIDVDAKAVCLIISKANATGVYNLDDARAKSVVVRVGGEQIVLAPGRHVTITSRQVSGFEAANVAHCIGHRNLSASNLQNSTLQAFTSDFSLAHTFAGVKQLRLLVSSTNPRARKLTAHLLKTSAIMSQLASGGQYQYYLPGTMAQTAMADDGRR